jgi:pyruvate/2-oxoglutarate dehydrogenase complex dihydrolipoamide dehydrogenase (E3) component
MGSGPGGYVAAIKDSKEGMSEDIIEKKELVGVC